MSRAASASSTAKLTWGSYVDAYLCPLYFEDAEGNGPYLMALLSTIDIKGYRYFISTTREGERLKNYVLTTEDAPPIDDTKLGKAAIKNFDFFVKNSLAKDVDKTVLSLFQEQIQPVDFECKVSERLIEYCKHMQDTLPDPVAQPSEEQEIMRHIQPSVKKMQNGTPGLLAFYNGYFIALYAIVSQDGVDYVTATAPCGDRWLRTWILSPEDKLSPEKRRELQCSCDTLFAHEIRQLLLRANKLFQPILQGKPEISEPLYALTQTSGFNDAITGCISRFYDAELKAAAAVIPQFEKAHQELKTLMTDHSLDAMDLDTVIDHLDKKMAEYRKKYECISRPSPEIKDKFKKLVDEVSQKSADLLLHPADVTRKQAGSNVAKQPAKKATAQTTVKMNMPAAAAQARRNAEKPDGETADGESARKEKIAKPAPKVAKAVESESAEVIALRNAQAQISALHATIQGLKQKNAAQPRQTVDVRDKEIKDLRAKLQAASLKTEELQGAEAEIERLKTALDQADKDAKAKEAGAEIARREAEIGAVERERQKDEEIKNLREQLSQIKSELDTANAARDTARAALGQSTDGIQRMQTHHLAIVTGLQRDYQALLATSQQTAAENAQRSCAFEQREAVLLEVERVLAQVQQRNANLAAENQAAVVENARVSAGLDRREQIFRNAEANVELRHAELQRLIAINTQMNAALGVRAQELGRHEEALARAQGTIAHQRDRLAQLAPQRVQREVVNAQRNAPEAQRRNDRMPAARTISSQYAVFPVVQQQTVIAANPPARSATAVPVQRQAQGNTTRLSALARAFLDPTRPERAAPASNSSANRAQP